MNSESSPSLLVTTEKSTLRIVKVRFEGNESFVELFVGDKKKVDMMETLYCTYQLANHLFRRR